MITRAEYMANQELHQDYYAEVAKEGGIQITDVGLLDECREALANGDKHLNTIPLSRWDVMAIQRCERSSKLRAALKARGDGYSLGGGVCILKAAVRSAIA